MPSEVERDAATTAALLPFGAAYAGAPADLLKRNGTFQFSKNRRRTRTNDEHDDPSVFNPATCTRKGKHLVPLHPKCSHSKPFNIYYEQHGTGPIKLVFLMGLATSCAGWLPQVDHFANARNGNVDRYSCLVYDQRGFGSSDVPKGRYRTSDMAHDLLSLLAELRWIDGDEYRNVHLVGVSMGGMVTLELAKMVPHHWGSITLVSTTSGQNLGSKSVMTGMPPFRGISTFANIIITTVLGTKTPRQHLNAMVELLFPSSYLSEPHPDSPQGLSRRECFQQMLLWRFQYSRHAPPDGVLRQISAVFTHGVTQSQLDRINREVPSISIVTGDDDHLVNPANSDYLAKYLDRARLVKMRETGHALPIQRTEELNLLIEQTVDLGVQRSKEAYWRDRTARAVL
ncbi:unnamed protein product [Tilletia controversa]|uniref:AB hydrolase-1 domain-containing protein n=3 Tax=Tilletia TaxID=13289 RepID=A0A8X7MNN5_9BASI|nr:hypothetical protein CF336_g6504 [Tilletia laevis]KAE8198825.1 hypothetical protein CF328_g3430 [Tilletia controversa]KAE8253562.1 hypothetical protein A4X03_0g5864 [Tilletia caries]KAE8192245.1 hypothetical protein CF335_g5886 [Tilletia laevis]KAE8242363.1 hypothetical protein A4X06_0g6970 [Tilletia controversa]